MNRLLPELNRLYGLSTDAMAGHGTRAVVLSVVMPVGWQQLGAVWRGVQSDLELPAPAIAVSGTDALQLWFSFASPISPAEGARFLEGLRDRYLQGVRPAQIGMFTEAAELPPAPCVEVGPQRWSAFVTHDLASIFDETPWLDLPPNDEGQANILRMLEPIKQMAFDVAMNQLAVVEDEVAFRESVAAKVAPMGGRPNADPARFLLGVMNDEAAPLALRIEAARALLPYSSLSS